jgi:hypothetical protein
MSGRLHRYIPAIERIMRRVVFASSGCWEFTGRLDPDGYGRAGVGGRQRMAHRITWEFTRGPIPDGLQIDHLCRNRACVNPSHLEVVDARTNTLRGISSPAINARKDRCRNGHPFTRLYKRAGVDRFERACLACRRERYHAERAAKIKEALA